ncbi:tetratricopeptide repeat protein [soil metagenome]
MFKALLIPICLVLLAACASERGARIGDLERAEREVAEAAPEADFHILIAEFALQRGEYEAAAEEYAQASRLSSDLELLRRATEVNYQYGQIDDALETARRWLELEPGAGEAGRYLVRLYLRAGQVDGAVEQIERLLDGADPPEDAFMSTLALLSDVQERAMATRAMRAVARKHGASAEAHYVLAALALRSGDPALATKSARRASRLRPEWTDARLILARALVLNGQIDAGLAEARALVADKPEPGERLEYALLLGSTGRTDEARELLNDMLTADPRNAEALRMLALLELEEENLEAAEAHLNALLVSGRYPYEAFYYLGAIAEKRKELERALRFYARVRASPYVVDAQIRTSRVLLELGDGEAGITHLAEMAEVLPEHAAALTAARGQLHADMGDSDAALAAYNEGLRRHPESEPLLYARAFLLERLDRVDEAVAELRRIVESRPDDPTALNALGFTLADRTDRHREAYEHIEKALELDPGNAAILDSMGWVLYKRGRHAAALAHLERAYALAPDPEIAAHLGEVLWVTGDQAKARSIWQTTLETHPDAPAVVDVMERFDP